MDHETTGPRAPARPPTFAQPAPHAAEAGTRVRPVRPIRFTPSRTEPIQPPSHVERAATEQQPSLIARLAAWIAVAVGWSIFITWWGIVLQRETARSLGVAIGLVAALLAICVIAMVAWTSYNKGLARKATRRRNSNRYVPIRWERDTLGRPLELPAEELACTAPEVRVLLELPAEELACTAPEVRVLLKDGVKAYVAVDPEEL